MTAYLLAILLLWPFGLGMQVDSTPRWWIERIVGGGPRGDPRRARDDLRPVRATRVARPPVIASTPCSVPVRPRPVRHPSARRPPTRRPPARRRPASGRRGPRVRWCSRSRGSWHATFAGAPGSPFQPVLPAGAGAERSLTALATAIGLDRLAGTWLIAAGWSPPRSRSADSSCCSGNMARLGEPAHDRGAGRDLPRRRS